VGFTAEIKIFEDVLSLLGVLLDILSYDKSHR